MVSELHFGKFTFIRHPGSPVDGCADPLIEFSVPGDAGEEELIQSFHRFMLACGFSAEIEIEIVHKEEILGNTLD